MVAVSIGVMKRAVVDASSCAPLAAVHTLGRMGEIAGGAGGIR
jgi:hypothetical protein